MNYYIILQSMYSRIKIMPSCLLLVFTFCNLTLYSQSTTSGYVGERFTLNAPTPPYGGTFDGGAWKCSNKSDYIGVAANGNGMSATVYVHHYFSGTATITCEYNYTYWDSYTKKRVVDSAIGYYYVTCKASSVKLNITSAELELGDDLDLTYTTNPLNLEPLIEWKSSDTDIATVDQEGHVSAKSVGTCTITADGHTGNPAPTCIINVVDTYPHVTSDVESGIVLKGSKVTLSCDKDGATIYYTTDGETPSKSSKKYTEPIVINEKTTLKARAYLGNLEGRVKTWTYTVSSHTVGEVFKHKTDEGVDMTFIVVQSGSSIYLYVGNGKSDMTAIDKDYSGIITIPEQVDDIRVRRINDYAFKGCNISGVQFPKHLQIINSYAFQDCKRISHLRVPSNITSIRTGAFKGCESTEAIVFVGSPKLHEEAFYGCKNLKDLYCHAKTPFNYGAKAFYSSPSIYENVTIHVPQNTIYSYRFDWGSAFKNFVEMDLVEIELSPSGGEVVKGTSINISSPNAPSSDFEYYIYDTNDERIEYETYSSISFPVINQDCKINVYGYNDYYDTNNVTAYFTIGQDPPVIEPTKVTLPSSKTIEVGESFTMSYTLEPANATTTLTWTSDDPSIATVSSSGIVTGVKAGSTWINVETSNGKRDYCKVTVNADEIEPTSITLPSSKTIEVGESFTMSYTLEPANATTSLTWTSDDSSIATVSSSGVVTGVKAGSTWINVETSNGKRAYCKVTVNSDEIEPTSITLPSSKTIEVGESFTMSYTLEPANATTTLTWTSDDSSIASVSSSGVVTGVKAGSTWINVETSNGKMDYCKVTVYTNDYEWHDGDVFTAQTEEGVEMKFRVISAKDKTCQVEEQAISSSITGKLTIPHSIHGLKVTRIYTHAFVGCGGLTSIVIPNSVTSIGNLAFSGCSGLISITIPKSVTSIGYLPFTACNSLTSIIVEKGNTNYDSRNDCNAIIETASKTLIKGCKTTIIPNDVTCIGGGAFQYCSGLTSIAIPNSVISIGDMAFCYCSDLTSITIPNSVTSIGDLAFYFCRGLKDVFCYAKDIPSTGEDVFGETPINYITLHVPQVSMEAYKTTSPWNEFGNIVALREEKTVIAFADKNVKAICVANWDLDGDGELSEKEARAVTTLGGVFKYNTSIESFDELEFFTGLTSIGYDAFHDCNSLTSITIPNSVTTIASYAFCGCTALTKIFIPESVATIEHSAFGECASLASITIPRNVSLIEDAAFWGCYSLKSIAVADDNQFYDARNNCNAVIETSTNKLIVGCKNTVIPNSVTVIGESAFEACGLKSITIPNLVTSIGWGAFSGNNELTSISIPESVTTIGVEAFSGCNGLKDVYCFATEPPSAGILTFHGSPVESITLHVPAESLQKYKNCKPWSGFKDIVPIDEVTSRDVTLSSAGYATFYDSQAAYSLPSGVKACVVTTASDDKLTYEELTEGFVPKGVAVMLKNEQLKGGTFTLTRVEDDTRYTGENLLCGSDEATMTSADGDCYFYKLAYGTKGSDLANVFGWYWGAAGGAAFMIEGHKAWLAIPKAQVKKIRSFSIEGEATAIASLEENETATEDNVVYYDLQGRRISQPTRNGIYIRNGKKVAFAK